jgi:hypothetical protein
MILNIFFSIKLIRQSRGQKNFPEGDKLPKVLPKSTVFQNPGGAAAPPGTLCIHPCDTSIMVHWSLHRIILKIYPLLKAIYVKREEASIINAKK